MTPQRIVIVGGGAAGFFAAIACAQTGRGHEVSIFEQGPGFLAKVRVSGGGRCNVTHACYDPDDLSAYYPRGGSALRGAFRRFQPQDTVEWFERRGVRLKTEPDGRLFPVTDSSQTIIDCLSEAARDCGVQALNNCGVAQATRLADGRFALGLTTGTTVVGDRLLLATGGCRTLSQGQLAASLGHRLEAPVPSLFSFHIEAPWLAALAGISVQDVEATVPGEGLRERNALLLTHSGVSGPAILRLSAWGARKLHARGYQFPLHVNWLPGWSRERLAQELDDRRNTQGARLAVNSPIAPLPVRLWEQLVTAAGIHRDCRWAALSRAGRHGLIQQLAGTLLPVNGKSLNKEEFVTCGGVRLSDVNFRTMESKICPGLYFAGELLDVDGVTGGFNFQAAWTTGWIAGRAMAGESGVAKRSAGH